MEDYVVPSDDELHKICEELWHGAPDLCRPQTLLREKNGRHRIEFCGNLALAIGAIAGQVIEGVLSLEEGRAYIANNPCDDCPLNPLQTS